MSERGFFVFLTILVIATLLAIYFIPDLIVWSTHA